MKHNLDLKEFSKEELINLRDTEVSNYTIKSDFALILTLVFELLLYLFLLIPRLFGLLFSLLLGKKESSKFYFEKTFLFPFTLLREIKKWFFEAKITSFLMLFLSFSFFVQYFFINPDEVLLKSLMTHTNHLFEGNYYSILTSIFLHGNIVHLLSNLLALLIFGRIVERQFRKTTLLIFVCSGVIANVISNFISYVLGDPFFSLGASGAIAGLIIFAIIIEPFAITSVLLLPLPIFILGWFLIFLDVVGLTNPSQVNHFAHLGGYLSLMILFFFLEIRHKNKVISGLLVNLILLVIMFLVIYFLGLDFSSNLSLLINKE